MAEVSGWVWDACGLLNLAATRRAEDILSYLDVPSYVVQEVRNGEVLYLRSLPEEDPMGKLVTVDLTPLLGAGLLQELMLDTVEQSLFVGFAASVDDGEARTAAVAVHCGWGMVIDDRATLRLLAAQSPPVSVLTTPVWVKFWADTTGASSHELGEVLRRIEVCAHFKPRKIDPLKVWWDTNLPP
jgi:hypothetical protein